MRYNIDPSLWIQRAVWTFKLAALDGAASPTFQRIILYRHHIIQYWILLPCAQKAEDRRKARRFWCFVIFRLELFLLIDVFCSRGGDTDSCWDTDLQTSRNIFYFSLFTSRAVNSFPSRNVQWPRTTFVPIQYKRLVGRYATNSSTSIFRSDVDILFTSYSNQLWSSLLAVVFVFVFALLSGSECDFIFFRCFCDDFLVWSYLHILTLLLFTYFTYFTYYSHYPWFETKTAIVVVSRNCNKQRQVSSNVRIWDRWPMTGERLRLLARANLPSCT